MQDPKTNAASVSDVEMEQAIAEAGKAEATETVSEEQTQSEEPQFGQAFQELAEKKGFKSVDDLVNAYKNIEGLTTKTAQEIADLKKLITKNNEPAKKDPYGHLSQEQRDALDLIRSVVNEEVNKTISPLREEYEVKKAGSVIEGIKKQYPFVNDSQVDEAITLMESNPSLSLEQAIKITSFETAMTSGNVARKQVAKTQEKKRAFAESGSTARTGDDTDYSKMSLEELEEILSVPKSGR